MSQHTTKQQAHNINKWIPAILGAIILHVVIILLFFNQQKPVHSNANENGKTTYELQNKTNHEDKDVIAAITGTQPQSLKTLTDNSQKTDSDASISEKQHKNQMKDNTTDNNEDVNLRNTAMNSTATSSAAEQTGQSKRTQTSSASNMLMTTEQENDSQQHATSSAATSVNNTTNPTATLPNNSIVKQQLLTRDIPASVKPDVDNSEYVKAAQEVEEINAKLSATIDSVKEKNMKEIEMARAKEKMAYLNDQHAQQTEIEQTDTKQTATGQTDNQDVLQDDSEAQGLNKQDVDEQIAVVSEQLGIDELADTEFSAIKTD